MTTTTSTSTVPTTTQTTTSTQSTTSTTTLMSTTTQSTTPLLVYYACYSLQNQLCSDMPGGVNSTAYSTFSSCRAQCAGYLYFGVQSCLG